MSRTRYLVSGLLAGGLVLRLRARRAEQRRAERLAAAALEALLNSIDANDRETGAHVRRVATYSLILARAAGFSWRVRRRIERVALFHDIGKIHAALFDVVHDPTSLSPAERALVMTHPQRGADVLRPLAMFYPDLASGVVAHHERWDGRGYPAGLRGVQIPLAARVVAIADAFDAMTHRRRYQRERPVDEAARALGQGRGAQFDPALVDLFLSPPVFESVREALRRSQDAQRARHAGPRPGQRPGSAEHAPDITFRWRSESLAQRPPAPVRRARRESPPPQPPPRE